MSSSKPPKIAGMIIRLLTRPGNRSLLLGDLEEDYRYYMSEKGLVYARLWYWMQIVIPIHNFIINQIYWSYYMFKNYFKSAYRNLFRNKTYGIVSILSLAITIGCAISLFSIVHIFYKFDTAHENRDRIFLVGTVIETNSKSEKWGIAPAPLAGAIKTDLSHIEDVVRITYQDGKMQYGEKVFYENICFADNGFLDMFTYPLAAGEKTALSEKDAVIITKNIALKYFGDEDPVGKQFVVTFNNSSKASFFVKGIAENMSILKTFGFEILLNYDNLDRAGVDHVNDWSKKPRATFLMLKDPERAIDIESQLTRYISLQNESDPDWMAKEFFLGPLEKIIYASSNIRSSITGATASEAFIIFSAIGLLLLILACINYINVSIASATKRIKEIGIRKVFGSRKNQLCIQFLSENLLVCLTALLFGILLAQTVFFPAFYYIGELNIEENIFNAFELWYMFPGILIFTSILSGLYPALFISSYNPVAIFRDKKIRIGKNLFTKILLGFQFVVSFI
ncbi:MAG: ABC transporter permease, partial [bacterium]|nr:ABC transporter permease [bacterium]